MVIFLFYGMNFFQWVLLALGVVSMVRIIELKMEARRKMGPESLLQTLSSKILDPASSGVPGNEYKFFGTLFLVLLRVEKEFGGFASWPYQKLRSLVLSEVRFDRKVKNILKGLLIQLTFLNFYLLMILLAIGFLLEGVPPHVFVVLGFSVGLSFVLIYGIYQVKDFIFKKPLLFQECIFRLTIFPQARLSVSEVLERSKVNELISTPMKNDLEKLKKQLLLKISYWREKGGNLGEELSLIENELQFFLEEDLIRYQKKVEAFKVLFLVFGFMPTLLWSYSVVLMEGFGQI